MSELFMECVEEELEPWQKQVPQVNLIDDDDDDDEPIFVGVLSKTQKDEKSTTAATQMTSPKKKETKSPASQPALVSSPIMLPLNFPANAGAPKITTMTPQPVIVNNQGFIVSSPQLTSPGLIASLGSHYPPGSSFAIVPAGQQHASTVLPGVVHRPQVQQISNNIVTLSNVQSPALYSSQPQKEPKRPNSQTPQDGPLAAIGNGPKKDQNPAKRELQQNQTNSETKKMKLDLESKNVPKKVHPENGITKIKCSRCRELFLTREQLNCHMMTCLVNVEKKIPPVAENSEKKRIMLVSDFYYGRFEGDRKVTVEKTNTTFKCQSCLKILKNNIRFMNHMKHHLELEKQNSESWDSHTTCHHCYRKYLTPFQLQCHIESAHSPIESSTTCKICELAFASEQVLLEHMKESHKPGEMPYVCQVCNYRSSFFSDVETHFRTAHENSKELLCPFCLKVLKSGHMYMQHYMKHQRKGIHRCGKCRLNFLSFKEKVEHRTQVHRTFKKPKALEGLLPGTKVTIRASLSGRSPAQSDYPKQCGITVKPECLSKQSKSEKTVAPKKTKAASVSKKLRRPNMKHNLALSNLSTNGGCHTCIECFSKVDHFFSHFPMVAACGACRYRTSCKVSIGNHMIRFHSTRKALKQDLHRNPTSLKLTLVCLNCDLLVDGSRGDLMTKHLTDRPNHTCRVIQLKDDSCQGKQNQLCPS